MRVSGFYTSGAIGSTLILLLLGKLAFNSDAVGRLFFDFQLISVYAISSALVASASRALVVYFRNVFGHTAEVGGFGLGLSYPILSLVIFLVLRTPGDSALVSIVVSSILVGGLSGLVLSMRNRNA